MSKKNHEPDRQGNENIEWNVFVSSRRDGRFGNDRPWIAVSGPEVVGQFASHDEAADLLVQLGNGNPDGAVFHILDEPVNLNVCRFSQHA